MNISQLNTFQIHEELRVCCSKLFSAMVKVWQDNKKTTYLLSMEILSILEVFNILVFFLFKFKKSRFFLCFRSSISSDIQELHGTKRKRTRCYHVILRLNFLYTVFLKTLYFIEFNSIHIEKKIKNLNKLIEFF